MPCLARTVVCVSFLLLFVRAQPWSRREKPEEGSQAVARAIINALASSSLAPVLPVASVDEKCGTAVLLTFVRLPVRVELMLVLDVAGDKK